MTQLRRVHWLAVLPLIVALLWGLCPSLAFAGTFSVFGKTYVRDTGAPVTVTDTFAVFNPNAPYTLHVQNLGVASAVISVNGVQVLGPSDFDPNVTSVDRAVGVATSNAIAVQLRSAPGSSLVISIIGIDNDPPVIVASASPSPNAAGWNNTNVVVTFSCSDKTSGVASCPSPVTVSTEGANQVISGTAADRAGNTASTSITLNIEKTPPSITASATPTPNGAGWNNSDVTVTFQCGTSISGGIQCPSPKVVNTEGANQTVSGTVSDLAGNSATATANVSLDKTPPMLTISSPSNGSASSVPTISVSGNATDALSGIATTSCNGVAATLQGSSFNCSVTLNAGANTIAVSASDVAGNSTSTSIQVTLGNLTAPAAPTALTARPDIGQVWLAWTASPGAAGYKAKRSATSGGPYKTIGISTTNTFVDTEVVGNTTYFYVVTAVNSLGESPNSNETSQTTLPTGPGTTIQDATGGTVTASDPQNPNAVVSIVIPPGVLGTTSDIISVTFSDDAPGPLNSNATAAGAHFVSRVITLTRASGLKFTKPILVTIPYDPSQVGLNDSMLVVYWDGIQSGYDVVDTVSLDRTNGTITFQTVHFSQYRAMDIPLTLPPITTTIPSPEQATDTGFRASPDGFPVMNMSSMVGAASGGACFGLTTFAKWFYETEVPLGQNHLAQNTIFNHGTAAEDDVAREVMYWAFDRTIPQNHDAVWLLRRANGDPETAWELFASLFVFGKPELVTLAVEGSYNAPTGLHSVLVYSYSTDTAANVIHFNFYDPNVPAQEQHLDYSLTSKSFGLAPYKDAFGTIYSWVYFTAASDFLIPSEFEAAFVDASNGWPDRHFNEIVVDEAKSTDLTLLSPEGANPVSSPAEYQISFGNTKLQMNWTCSCGPLGDTQEYGHVFFDGLWRDDIFIPIGSASTPTPFEYDLPLDAVGREMIVVISRSPHDLQAVSGIDTVDRVLAQGYEGFLRIKLKPPLYQVTQINAGASAQAFDYPCCGNYPYQLVYDNGGESCVSNIQQVYPAPGTPPGPFSANVPLACVGQAHAPGGVSFNRFLDPPFFSDSLSASLGSASANASFEMQFNPSDMSFTANWSAVSGDLIPCSDPFGCVFTFYTNNAAANASASFEVKVYAPVHYHIQSGCSSSVLPQPPRPLACGGLYVNGHPYAVNSNGFLDVGLGLPQPPLIASIDGVFSTYDNTIVVNMNGGGGSGYGNSRPSITGTLSLSISLAP